MCDLLVLFVVPSNGCFVGLEHFNLMSSCAFPVAKYGSLPDSLLLLEKHQGNTLHMDLNTLWLENRTPGIGTNLFLRFFCALNRHEI